MVLGSNIFCIFIYSFVQDFVLRYNISMVAE